MFKELEAKGNAGYIQEQLAQPIEADLEPFDLDVDSDVVLDSGTRTGTGNFVKNRNRKFEKSPYPEPNRNRLNTRRVPDGS